jgi:ribosomal protein S20
MANSKSSKKRILNITRNTIQNKKYYKNVKTFIKKYFLSLETYRKEPNLSNLEFMLKIISFIESKLDKAAKINVLSKNKVSRKKAFFNNIQTYFLSLEIYKNEPNLLHLETTLKNLYRIYDKHIKLLKINF